MNNERGLRGFILSRFFIILIIVSLVEFTVVLLTNRLLIPFMISTFKLDEIIQATSSENIFLIIFVLIATWIINSILPFFKVSPVAVNSFLEGLIAERGSEAVAATESIKRLTQDTKTTILLALAVIFIAIVLVTPYVIGGIIFSLSVAKEIRINEKEKEEARQREEKRRYLMISNIVHDLKTPMTTVYGYAKALNDGVVPEDKKSEYLDAIMAKSDRMNDVVAMLLDYVKLDSEGFTIKKERTDICELVRACCAFSFTDIETAGDEIDVVIPDHPIFIQADNKQLSRVITNLITNAIRHNPEGTKIRVSITSESDTTASDVRAYLCPT